LLLEHCARDLPEFDDPGAVFIAERAEPLDDLLGGPFLEGWSPLDLECHEVLSIALEGYDVLDLFELFGFESRQLIQTCGLLLVVNEVNEAGFS